MTERVNLGRLGSTAATVGFVAYEVVGGFTHLKGLSSFPENELNNHPHVLLFDLYIGRYEIKRSCGGRFGG